MKLILKSATHSTLTSDGKQTANAGKDKLVLCNSSDINKHCSHMIYTENGDIVTYPCSAYVIVDNTIEIIIKNINKFTVGDLKTIFKKKVHVPLSFASIIKEHQGIKIDILLMDNETILKFPEDVDEYTLEISPNVAAVTQANDHTQSYGRDISRVTALNKNKISFYDYIKSSIDNEFISECNNNIKKLYSAMVAYTVYSELEEKQIIKQWASVSESQKLELNSDAAGSDQDAFNASLKSKIKDLNVDFYKNLIYGSYETIYNKNYSEGQELGEEAEAVLKMAADAVNLLDKKPASGATVTGVPTNIQTGTTFEERASLGVGDSQSGDWATFLVGGGGITINLANDSQQGGNKDDYRNLQSFIEKVAEVKHDFGGTDRAGELGDWSPMNSATYGHGVANRYDGSLSGEEKVVTAIAKKLRGCWKDRCINMFNGKENIDIMKESGGPQGKFEAHMLHKFMYTPKYHMNIDVADEKLTQLNNYFFFWKFNTATAESKHTQYKLNTGFQLNKVEIPEDFKITFKAQLLRIGIKHLIFDTSASIAGQVKIIQNYLMQSNTPGLKAGETYDAITHIVPLISMWDPASSAVSKFNCSIDTARVLGDEAFANFLKETSLEFNTTNSRDMWFPKRSSISGYYSIRYNKNHEIDPLSVCTTSSTKTISHPLSVYIKTKQNSPLPSDDGYRADEHNEHFTEIKLVKGFGVKNLARAMACILDEDDEETTLKATGSGDSAVEDTRKLRELVKALRSIQFNDFDGLEGDIAKKDGVIDEAGKNKLRVRILLDMKKTGDWAQIKWIRKINKSFPQNHKTVFITGDKLCALVAILNGIPTIFGTSNESETFVSGTTLLGPRALYKLEHPGAKGVGDDGTFSFYQGSASKLTFEEIEYEQTEIKKYLGVDCFEGDELLSYDVIEPKLKTKIKLLNHESFTSTLQDLEKLVKYPSSSERTEPVIDYMQIKLNEEIEPDNLPISDEIKTKNVLKILFAGQPLPAREDDGTFRKNWNAVNIYKAKLKDGEGMDFTPEAINLAKIQETLIRTKLTSCVSLKGLFQDCEDFISVDYSDILSKTNNIVRCINLINSDIIYGYSGLNIDGVISKPHIDEINTLCGIDKQYEPGARGVGKKDSDKKADDPKRGALQKSSLYKDVNEYRTTFTINFKEKVESQLEKIKEEDAGIEDATIDDLENILSDDFCYNIYGKSTKKDWFRSDLKIHQIMKNMSGIITKILEVESLQKMYVTTVSKYDSISNILSSLNLYCDNKSNKTHDKNTQWIRNIFQSRIEIIYFDLLGVSRDETGESDKTEDNLRLKLYQIVTNIKCIIRAMDKMKSNIIDLLGGSGQAGEFDDFRKTLEDQSTTFSNMHNMINKIINRGVIRPIDHTESSVSPDALLTSNTLTVTPISGDSSADDPSDTEQITINIIDVGDEKDDIDQYSELISKSDTLDTPYKFKDFIEHVDIDPFKETLLEETEEVILEPKPIIKVLDFPEGSKSKFIIHQGKNVKIIKCSKSKRGFCTVGLLDGESKVTETIYINKQYIKPVPAEVQEAAQPASPEASPLPVLAEVQPASPEASPPPASPQVSSEAAQPAPPEAPLLSVPAVQQRQRAPDEPSQHATRSGTRFNNTGN
jgi:hypothetical protein